MSRFGFLTAIFLSAVAMAGCGDSNEKPGLQPPKRALDPRAEALRFFPAGTQIVFLLDTVDPDALATLDQDGLAIRTWSGLRGNIDTRLREAGVDSDQILNLSRTEQNQTDLPAPELVMGAEDDRHLERQGPLFVLPTDKGVELAALFDSLAQSGPLEPAGSFDEAHLFSGPAIAFAVRDGVLIGAGSIRQLRSAIKTRDGDSKAQLDDAAVSASLTKLPDDPALKAYVVSGGDNGLATAMPNLLAAAPWLNQVDDASIGFTSETTGLAIDVVAQLSPDRPEGSGPDLSEAPQGVALSKRELRSVFGSEAAGDSRVTSAIIDSAPLDGKTSLRKDEVRAHLTVAGR